MQIFGRSIAAALAAGSPRRAARRRSSQAVVGDPRRRAPGEPANETMTELAAEAQTHFDRALKAQRDGDWATYGEEIKKVADVLDRMNKIKK